MAFGLNLIGQLFSGIGSSIRPPQVPTPQNNQNSSNINYNYNAAVGKVAGPVNPSYSNLSSIDANRRNVLGASTYAPSVGGQSAGGGGGGGSVNLQGPSSFTPDPGPSLDYLRGIYNQNAQDLQSQSGQYDQSYNTAKGDIQSNLDQATNTANTRKSDLDTQFGSVLKNQLKTYQDLNRQRQGTFSALGTLDSSAFNEDQFRADQNLSEQTGQTNLEKTKSLKSVDDQLQSYTQQAQSSLAQLATQYQSGKQAIASALAHNNLDEANAINSYIGQIQQQAANVQNQMVQFANQAAMLKAQGTNVNLGINGISGDPYAQQVQQYLSQLSAQGANKYAVPTQSVNGQGYISPSGKRYNSQQEYLLALQQGQA